ncbi:MAG: hypothetical protein PWP14_296 [Methanolobus sp.]|jgi:hypothetical protein|nr:hypothetical protein [Methanolobus sp.]
MHPKNLFLDRSAALGLPVRIVVLSIIGMIGMYAILYAVLNAPLVPGTLYATVDNSSFTLAGGQGDSPVLRVQVFDSGDVPVGGANVVLWCPTRQKAVGGLTGPGGTFETSLSNISLPAGKNEGYIAIRVMQEGYMDYSDEFFVKVRKG